MLIFCPRYCSHRILCTLLAALTALSPAIALAQQNAVEPRVQPNNDKTLLAGGITTAPAPAELDLAYILPDAAFVLAVRPGQLLQSAAGSLMPVEILQAAMQKEWGLDPVDAQQLVVSVAPPMKGPPSFAIYTKFNQPIKLKEGELTQHAEPAVLNGKPYYKSKDPMAPSLISPQPNTLLAAPDHALSDLLEDVDVAGDLAQQLADKDAGDDLLAIIDVATLRPLIFMALGQADVPEGVQPFLQAPNLIKQIEARVNLAHAGTSELVVTANSEADAERLIALVDDAKEHLMKQMSADIDKALASEDPVEQAAGRYSQRMTKLWDEHLKLEREGDKLVLLRGDISQGGGVASMAAVGVLTALLLPAVQAAREAARRNSSTNNVKQLMLAMLNYESATAAYPAHASYSDDGKPLLSWRVHVLPYLEQQALYQQFHLDEPWDSEHNRALISQMPDLFRDPSSPLPASEGKTHYLGVEGESGVFNGTKDGRKIKTITDGTSNTIALVQVGDADAVTWTKPEDFRPDDKNLLEAENTLHPGVFIVGFCDGSVRFISQSIDAEVFKSLLTADGDEAIPGDAF